MASHERHSEELGHKKHIKHIRHKKEKLMRCGAGVFDVAPDPPGYEEDAGDADQEIETVKPGL